ncbi:MAG: hypothetical protein O7H39_20305, partial [Gammaproteobacteria bacterium]|nr:hypothetical protein [Gammaproteobacteria bacterium]
SVEALQTGSFLSRNSHPCDLSSAATAKQVRLRSQNPLFLLRVALQKAGFAGASMHRAPVPAQNARILDRD